MDDKDLVPVSEQIPLLGFSTPDQNLPPTRGKSGQRLTFQQKQFAMRQFTPGADPSAHILDQGK